MERRSPIHAAADRLEQQEQRITELERELAAAKEDMAVGWLCYCCAHRVKGKEWAFCDKMEAFSGTEDKVAMCKRFEWRGAREGEGSEV